MRGCCTGAVETPTKCIGTSQRASTLQIFYFKMCGTMVLYGIKTLKNWMRKCNVECWDQWTNAYATEMPALSPNVEPVCFRFYWQCPASWICLILPWSLVEDVLGVTALKMCIRGVDIWVLRGISLLEIKLHQKWSSFNSRKRRRRSYSAETGQSGGQSLCFVLFVSTLYCALVKKKYTHSLL